MALLFTFILLIHGLIHLIGVIKAFSLADLPDINLSVSKPMGILWLIVTILFIVSSGLFLFDQSLWWAAALPAVLMSQVLIISTWRDAKFGTIPNIIILVVAIGGYADYSFEQKVESEINQIYSSEEIDSIKAELSVNIDMINRLPQPVQRWLEQSGALGKPMVSNVRLIQEGELKTDPDQENWSDTAAEQYVNLENPSFVWSVDMEMMPLVYVSGRDLFLDGKGEMPFGDRGVW